MRKLILVLLCALASAQPLSDSVKIGPNSVMITARHCQKYMVRSFWHWRKHLTKGGAVACQADPSTVFYSSKQHNLKTNAGVDFIAGQISGTASGATAQWIALSTSSTSPSATDTSLPSEIVGNGLSRAQGTYAHTSGTTSYTVSNIFTASGSQSGIWKTGLLTAASSGTLVYEVLAGASVSLNSGDQLSVVWTVTIS